LSHDPWRTEGDTVERLELCPGLSSTGPPPPPARKRRRPPRDRDTPRPGARCLRLAEGAAFLAALDGRAVAPGPSGAPTRGRPDVLPTGRNFFSVDARALPPAPPGRWATAPPTS
jgi:cobaltochelatase CobN